jgi:hypothetical protein
LFGRLEEELREEIAAIEQSERPSSGLKEMGVQGLYLDGTPGEGGLDEGQSVRNNAGRSYGKGMNAYGGLSLAAWMGHRFLFSFSPEIRYLENDAPGFDASIGGRIHEGYVKYHTSVMDIQAGKISLWWGQGESGTLLLTDNMEPLPMIRLHPDKPFALTLFSRPVWFDYDFFISRLEEDRDHPEPYFWGLRLGFRPIRSWELGLARTAMLGGGDRPVTLETALRSLTGIGENSERQAGNQIGGIDTRYRGRILEQPFALYGEYYGEDEAGGVPYKQGYLVGLHLPEIRGFPRHSAKVEYADNTRFPGAWYRHGVYGDGYTYQGRIMGHPMGADARDLFLKWEAYFRGGETGFLSFERIRYGVFSPSPGQLTDYSVGIRWDGKNGIEWNASFTLQDVQNLDLTPETDFTNQIFMLGLRKSFRNPR